MGGEIDSERVGGKRTLTLFLSNSGGIGRARDAVEESIGLASEEEMTAGTEEDLIISARLAARLANDMGFVFEARGDDDGDDDDDCGDGFLL